jgi:hypothetical protein
MEGDSGGRRTLKAEGYGRWIRVEEKELSKQKGTGASHIDSSPPRGGEATRRPSSLTRHSSGAWPSRLRRSISARAFSTNVSRNLGSKARSPIAGYTFGASGWEAYAELSTQEQAFGGCLGAVNRPNCPTCGSDNLLLIRLRRKERTGLQVLSRLPLNAHPANPSSGGGRNPVSFSGFSVLNLVSWAAPFTS